MRKTGHRVMTATMEPVRAIRNEAMVERSPMLGGVTSGVPLANSQFQIRRVCNSHGRRENSSGNETAHDGSEFHPEFPSKGFDNEGVGQCLETCTLSCSKMGHFAAQHRIHARLFQSAAK
jgi:hypothetical protein